MHLFGNLEEQKMHQDKKWGKKEKKNKVYE